MSPPSHAWAERLERLAREQGDLPWLVLPQEPHRSSSHRSVSYAELFERARTVAQGLRARGVLPGERIVLVATNEASACLAVFGALLAGAVVVPCAPPSPGHPPASWAAKLEPLVAACRARLIVAPPALVGWVQQKVPVADVESLSSGRVAALRDLFHHAPDDVVLVQHTSGTTSAPRGVVLSHGNVAHNVHCIGQAMGARPREVGVSWLPLFHDMGLIGALLFTAAWGMSLVLLRPQSFTLRPEGWLWSVSRFGAVCTVAPGFAYQLCATRLSDARIAGADLGTLRACFVGAELIYAEALDAFAQRFAGHGFAREALWPVYGLAENTVAATLPEAPRAPLVHWVDRTRLERTGQARTTSTNGPDARGVVGVGRSLSGQRIRIVGEQGELLPGAQVGEIQLQGPSTTRGYDRSDERTERTADGPLTPDGWLRTGDRGYLLGEELFVVGRQKHIVKHLGNTIDCAFVEGALKGLPEVRGGAVAVFGVPDAELGSELLVVAVEVSRDVAADSAEIRAVIARAARRVLPFSPDRILLLRPGSIPRTTSGKVRHALVEQASGASG